MSNAHVTNLQSSEIAGSFLDPTFSRETFAQNKQNP